MDIAISIITVLIAWRFLASLAIAGALAVPIWQLFGPSSGLSIALIGVGFGFIWQGRKLSGIPLVASVPTQPISKPVAFLGLAFVGAIWGGFASEALGSVIAGAFTLIACVAMVGAWQTLILKRHELLSNLMFSTVALLFGLGTIFLVSTFRA